MVLAEYYMPKLDTNIFSGGQMKQNLKKNTKIQIFTHHLIGNAHTKT